MRRALQHIGASTLFAAFAALVIFVGAPAPAQIPTLGIPPGGLVPRYQAVANDSSLSVPEYLTIQQVANGPQISFRWGSVYCSAACTVQFFRNASADGTHPPIKTIYGNAPASAVAWLGTPLSPPGTVLASYPLAAGQTQPFDLSEFVMGSGAGAASTLSMGVSAITSGKITFVMEWTEVF